MLVLLHFGQLSPISKNLDSPQSIHDPSIATLHGGMNSSILFFIFMVWFNQGQAATPEEVLLLKSWGVIQKDDGIVVYQNKQTTEGISDLRKKKHNS